MSYRPNILVPFKFYDADRLNPDHLNDNAVSLDQAARWLYRHRYTYSVMTLPFGSIPNGGTAGYRSLSVQAKADYEIISASLYGEENQTLTADLAGFNTVTAPADGQGLANQEHLAWPSGTTVVFTVSEPGSATVVSADVVLRHDRLVALTDAGVTIPAAPRVKANDTRSVTEWNTWFTNLADFLGDNITANLAGVWPYARRMEVLGVSNNEADLATITSGQAFSRIYVPGRTGHLEYGHVWIYGDSQPPVTGPLTLTAAYHDEGAAPAADMWSADVSPDVGSVDTYSDLATAVGTNACANSPGGDDGQYINFSTAGGGNCWRAYVTLHWRE